MMLIVTSSIGCFAADLGSELAWWGPLTPGENPIESGNWFAEALVIGTTSDRLDGLTITKRRGGADAQAVVGIAFDRSGRDPNGRKFSDTFEWGRAWVRGGTDALAAEAESPFAAAGAAYHYPEALSLQLEAGRSSERGAFITGEACLMIFRVRVEHELRLTTVRVGSGPRWLGSTTQEMALGILVDYAFTVVDAGAVTYRREGAIAESFVAWRPWRQVLIAGSVAIASRVIERDDPGKAPRSVAGQLALALGATF